LLNPLTSALIGQANDGKVSVTSAFSLAAKEKAVLPVSHTWMATDRQVIGATVNFLACGSLGLSKSVHSC